MYVDLWDFNEPRYKYSLMCLFVYQLGVSSRWMTIAKIDIYNIQSSQIYKKMLHNVMIEL